ncbi:MULTISPECIES: DUF2493 domain-containing protein [Methylobacterium]|jgi:YspA, cpYpsA-related SLOG family|uniref:YspA cpYpsA-related SLOG domain-containing protein n=1 Tax=Methylobacterium radiotolerans (strain ATCC 27329 / DSM 1819 / JCM 2831 / NBRC 15690 / NCIMB 10815 / 0-1) TaxID=426355 RepID=B1M914_METRJ|nr:MULTISPECIES: DUF2493 domain-containing protein [Methylobacterium]GAN47387.1 hypothetical protein ME121_1394 [Methylobacterium sp. ME121]ACB27989.1 conserved hypothetical protein [Methylobacterium radiotolerans JCM 2831]KTS06280.1 hypothetical protein SB3_20155 [Methylobacterium radiotolerans]KTS48719.1 hypothetical protein SB2_09805 [Methylobacterium radiotolerans]MBN6823853.1 DUF2493 domain-containing protein [Methylobacterium organophilum]
MLDQLDAPSTFLADHATEADPSLLSELLTQHHRPFEEHADPRPMPKPEAVEEALVGAMNALADLFTETRLEDDTDDVLWGFVNLFHRRVEILDRKLDDNEVAQRQSQREQDGSEVRSVELERQIALGLSLTERRNAFEFSRDAAAGIYRVLTGTPWRPRTGSQINRATMTAAMIDSRDFLAAKRKADTELLVPPGPRILFTGGQDYQDVDRIWAVLDKVRAKHPDMVLLHGGSPKGAELIAAKWADTRKVPHVAFKPDWTRHGRAAPFRRNDLMLDQMPIGVVHFPGNGICDNLADKARERGVPVRRGVRASA